MSPRVFHPIHITVKMTNIFRAQMSLLKRPPLMNRRAILFINFYVSGSQGIDCEEAIPRKQFTIFDIEMKKRIILFLRSIAGFNDRKISLSRARYTSKYSRKIFLKNCQECDSRHIKENKTIKLCVCVCARCRMLLRISRFIGNYFMQPPFSIFYATNVYNIAHFHD